MEIPDIQDHFREGARMYPETDIPPFTIEQSLIDNIKENLSRNF